MTQLMSRPMDAGRSGRVFGTERPGVTKRKWPIHPPMRRACSYYSLQRSCWLGLAPTKVRGSHLLIVRAI